MTISATPRFPIRVAAQRAGVSVATLRAWERRYGAVAPARTDGDQRLYSEADVERIALLRRLAEDGHAISAVASVETVDLRRLLGAETAPHVRSSATASRADDRHQRTIAACLRAIAAHDGDAVYRLLLGEAIRANPIDFVESVAAPLSRRLGDGWAAGRISEAQERVASNAIRRLLGFLIDALGVQAAGDARPRVLVTTLNGERHENGVLMAGVIAALAGCEVRHPGADLPAAAIAAAAQRARIDIVAVSVVDAGAPRIAQRELAALREALPARTRIAIGGAAAGLLDLTSAGPRTTRFASLAHWHEALLAEAG